MLSSPHFVKKNVNFLKNTVLSCHIYQIFHEKPSVSCPYLAKERQFSKNSTIFLTKKDIMMPLFYYLSRKNQCSYAHILSKNGHSLKKHTAAMPIVCQINVHSLKNTVLSCNFFNFFMKTPLFSSPLVTKNENSVKSTLYYGAKNSIGCLFPRFFTKKITMLIFCQKTFIV